ncbi:hypothetical protein BDV96DRAFT_137135 [Lophiotrema nucula]|uniref:Ribosome assembly protein 3 n=1 Tax=Lophiotrema nucula TaxID=690887 RepID=A0A6A5ZS69_9PLEO|nr:hypothetical protein BDV96DRAFT_137135 [Lophiotrema nucula]
MPGQLIQNGAAEELKRKRKKKKKSRTVDLSSDSESDARNKRRKEHKSPATNGVKAETSSSKDAAQPISASPDTTNDISITSLKSQPAEVSPAHRNEDFTSIYLRKITAELGDDVVKLRDASDFTDRSIPLLRHALTQGASIFSDEEKRRVMSGVKP